MAPKLIVVLLYKLIIWLNASLLISLLRALKRVIFVARINTVSNVLQAKTCSTEFLINFKSNVSLL